MGSAVRCGDRRGARGAVRGVRGVGGDRRSRRPTSRPAPPARPSTPARPAPAGKHGDVVWAREIKRAPKGADAWRILYRSEDANGKATVSSGFLAAPEGRAPKGGRPVLAWAHGTEGAADNCAPVEGPEPGPRARRLLHLPEPVPAGHRRPGIKQFLDKGYAVVATDYAGLGTPGTQQYTVAEPELRNVLDSVIATQRFAPAAGGKRAVVLGWSQGGGAAIWADQEAGYAPSVKVLGAAALAPAADNGPEFANQTPPGPVTPSSPFHGAAIQLNVYVGNDAAYPRARSRGRAHPGRPRGVPGRPHPVHQPPRLRDREQLRDPGGPEGAVPSRSRRRPTGSSGSTRTPPATSRRWRRSSSCRASRTRSSTRTGRPSTSPGPASSTSRSSTRSTRRATHQTVPAAGEARVHPVDRRPVRRQAGALELLSSPPGTPGGEAEDVAGLFRALHEELDELGAAAVVGEAHHEAVVEDRSDRAVGLRVGAR